MESAMGTRDFAARTTRGDFGPFVDAVQTPRALLSQRRAALIADTAARLLKGCDPDSEVLPMLYEALAAERLVDASLGFIVTEGSETMKLGFIKGFPANVVQRCLPWTSARRCAEPLPRLTRPCTSPTSSNRSTRLPTWFDRRG
jgi:hypothetical protein